MPVEITFKDPLSAPTESYGSNGEVRSRVLFDRVSVLGEGWIRCYLDDAVYEYPSEAILRVKRGKP